MAADGGARSPFALLFFMPIAFAALSYPLPSVVISASTLPSKSTWTGPYAKSMF